MPLYHFEIGFPKNLEKNVKKIGKQKLEYGFHAKKAAMNDRYGIIDLPESLDFSKAKLIEAEVINNRLTKMVLRASYDNRFDLIVVVNTDLTVRTVWLNSRRDKHRTLDRSKYDLPLAA